MSRLRDIGHVWKHIGPWTFVKRMYNQTYEDNLLVWAAALAFSWLFAVFPFLIFCLSLVPLLPDRVWGVPLKPDSAQVQEFVDAALVTGEQTLGGTELDDEGNPTAEEVEAQREAEAATEGWRNWRAWLGVEEPESTPATRPTAATTTTTTGARAASRPSTEPADTVAEVGPDQPVDVKPDKPGVQQAPITRTISDIVEGILNNASGQRLTISLLIALFTASGGLAMTMAGLDSCYDVAPNKMRPLWISRPVAMLLTIVMAIMILAAVILIPVGSLLLTRWGRITVFGMELKPMLWLIDPLRYALGLLLLFGVLGLVYRFGPSLKTRLHLFSPGSVFCVVMWLLTARGFRIYLDSFGAAANYEKTYGAVAGVAILMLLFYLNALFLLIGAEINAEIDFIRLGIRSGPLPEEQAVAPVPTYQLDEEDRELKEELEDRRSIDVSPEVAADEFDGQGAGI